jgi:glycosyltransferase involved in cell wall biosynthesis
MKINESVSVIIPFYSGVEWLREAVESVINQTYKPTEIIVVNDGSKENVDDFLYEYGERIKYIIKENGGPATARNMGIEIANGEFIAFLDSDDLWLPQKLEKQIKYMIDNGCVWSHTGYETFNTDGEKGNVIKSVNISKFEGMIYPKMLFSNPIATPGIIIKKEILMTHPLWRFNNEMRYGQDQYLWSNIATEYKLGAINEPLVRVRIRGSNAALRARVQLRARAIIYNKVVKPNQNSKYRIRGVGLLGFKICVFGEQILCWFEKRSKSSVFLEFVSKLLYFFPWIMFKLVFKFYK